MGRGWPHRAARCRGGWVVTAQGSASPSTKPWPGVEGQGCQWRSRTTIPGPARPGLDNALATMYAPEGRWRVCVGRRPTMTEGAGALAAGRKRACAGTRCGQASGTRGPGARFTFQTGQRVRGTPMICESRHLRISPAAKNEDPDDRRQDRDEKVHRIISPAAKMKTGVKIRRIRQLLIVRLK